MASGRSFSRLSSLMLLISTPTPLLVKTSLLRPLHFFASLPYPSQKLLLVPMTPMPVLLSPFLPSCNKLSLGAQLSLSIRCQRQCCNTVMSHLHTLHISKPRFRIPNSTIRKSRSRYIPGTVIKIPCWRNSQGFICIGRLSPKGTSLSIVKRGKVFSTSIIQQSF